jgi:hypothetical protein
MKIVYYICTSLIVILFLYLLFSTKDDYKEDEKKGTILISTCGGLGNQLFQICFGYSISRKNNSNLLIMPSGDNFHVVDNLRYYDSIFKDFRLHLVNRDYVRDYLEPDGQYNKFVPELLNEKCNTSKLFGGYFQSEKYFIDYKDELINILTDNSVYYSVRESVDKNKMNYSYFIHVRRGDYLNSSFHYINLDVYYRNAINYILNIDRTAHFYIISDDIEYCKRYNVIKDINKTFYENQDELETMYFMSLCNKGGVCANSTFSWFGSYLNRNPDKIVIFPDKWDNSSNVESDIYYTNSIVLPIK